MSPVNASDLPPEVRKRLGLVAPGRQRRNTAKGSHDSAACAGRCHDCGEAFAAYTKWEHHADATGHRRWAVELPGSPPVTGKALPSGDTGEAL